MASKTKDQNLLDLRPRRLFEHKFEGDRVSVLVPRFRSRWMGWLQRRLRRPYLQLHLDEVGSRFWLACDGQRKLSDIGRELEADFGEQVAPVWDRVALFAQHMHRGQLITLEE